MESRFSRPTKFELPNYIIPFTNPLGTNASMVQPSVGMFVLGFHSNFVYQYGMVP